MREGQMPIADFMLIMQRIDRVKRRARQAICFSFINLILLAAFAWHRMPS